MTDELVLHRGVGAPTRCRSCKKPIVFAVHHNGGKKAPFEIDPKGEWQFVNGLAMHVGPPTNQLELGGPAEAQRYTPHFSLCPQAGKWRGRRV